MKILVVGGGGREHAIIRSLKKNPSVETIYALPGNGGIARDAVCVPIGAKDIPAITAFAKEQGIDYAVVTPDDPLALGCVDALEAEGIPCFGPRQRAAMIESSKVFAKDLMARYGIPTAACRVFDDPAAALSYVETAPLPAVVKADGLALGKGVIIAFTRQEARDAVRAMMTEKKFGDSGSRVVIEEFLEGPEVSVLAFTDGETVVPMVSSMDHKRAGDGDTGLNTGGMGTVAPNPYYTSEVAKTCMERIFLPTIRAMKAEGREFRGCLYFGLMITREGPKVIEYNCRFGDPETQVVLPLMESDLLETMRAVTEGRLKDTEVRFREGAACCLVLASKGYPEAYEKGAEIRIPEKTWPHVFVAGAAEKDGKLVTSGGRVLGVTAVADSLPEAVKEAYALGDTIDFKTKYFRRDIGSRALKAISSSVRRIYVEKKPGLDQEAEALRREAVEFLGLKGLKKVRLLNRYDTEGLSEALFAAAAGTVFSEPPVDDTYAEPDFDGAAAVFAVEYLPGQFDQRADSAAQCVQMLSGGERPLIRSAKVYALYGELSPEETAAFRRHVINPVEAREAAMEKPATLRTDYAVPTEVAVLDGFRQLDRAGLEKLVSEMGLAMDGDDIAFCQRYFRDEGRDPTITEIRMLDTYWSDHCRHTTFLTRIDSAAFADPLCEKAWEEYLAARRELGRTAPVCLMDVATVGARYLKKKGLLPRLDESEEINACTVKIEIERDGVKEPWLLLFKNETHNHPTEIEPFGGAATCIGGAIRDPLSGRAYVYGAMRVTGAGDPTAPVSETIPGKLPQRKLVTTAAAGYSSYGNQIGLATGIVDELYHPGYAAKRLEIGAVIAAAPAENVRRERPAPGDVVILLGGRTGRDGIGGATGSSKAHNVHSVETCGAEVQKGNAPEERKLQRLFRDPAATRLIKRCNDFGAGGVSVAIGELADGLEIDLNAVPKKYDGLDGTELAISESQERMAVVVAPEDRDAFLALAAAENLEATPVAVVREEPRLVMKWNGKKIVDISRAFLNANGAEKHIDIRVPAGARAKAEPVSSLAEACRRMGSLALCSRRGLSERFDSTIGAGTVLMPFGGKNQLTPIQAMAHRLPLAKGETEDCSLMAWGFNPALSEKSPYRGAYLAVVESVCKLIATGAAFEDVYLTFQEYFEKPGKDPERWGQPLAALLGAFRAQMDLGIAAIGGKDSMSGSFEDLDVPPTLVSFAVTMGKIGEIVSPEFKAAGHPVILLSPEKDENGLPKPESLKKTLALAHSLTSSGRAVSASALGVGGALAAVIRACLGNGLGFTFDGNLNEKDLEALWDYAEGSLILEMAEETDIGVRLGTVTAPEGGEAFLRLGGESVGLSGVARGYLYGGLETVYPIRDAAARKNPEADFRTETFSAPAPESWPRPAAAAAKPRILIPVFPGTNCEYDSARAVERAGAEARIFVVRNRNAADIAESAERFAQELRQAQMVFLPGGFSGGDEPDGSGKLITAFFRGADVKAETMALLEKRGGLMLGICNGFQALIKLGLVPYGRIIDPAEDAPTLTFNTIGRHQSRVVRTRITSVKSPFLRLCRVGEVYSVPISHGEGRFLAEEKLIRRLAENGQIATQYVDEGGEATMDIDFNPNGSLFAVEGITSPDGRVFGKMGHSERTGRGLYRNVPGNYDSRMFEAAVQYFREV